MGMVYNGGTGLHNTSLHNVYSPERAGFTVVANHKLGYGRHVCMWFPPVRSLLRTLLILAQTTHYLYRAILAPLVLNPSMAPIHPFVWVSALAFQLTNAISIGGWLGGHGPTTVYDWAGRLYTIEIGMVIWGFGLLANMYHDDDLREIRRAADRRQRKEAEQKAKDEGKTVDKIVSEGVDKVYMLPKNGLFHYVLYAHYFCEWIEWAGFWMVGGWACVPARSFLINEVASMLPRALQGWHWYVAKFGREKVGNRKAIIPGIL
jgi:3-oxo-5-alpha-steroid 4-dehydrogenase 1